MSKENRIVKKDQISFRNALLGIPTAIGLAASISLPTAPAHAEAISAKEQAVSGTVTPEQGGKILDAFSIGAIATGAAIGVYLVKNRSKLFRNQDNKDK